MVDKGIPALLFQASLNDESVGLWQRCERVKFGRGHLSWVFSVSKAFQPHMEAQ